MSHCMIFQRHGQTYRFCGAPDARQVVLFASELLCQCNAGALLFAFKARRPFLTSWFMVGTSTLLRRMVQRKDK